MGRLSISDIRWPDDLYRADFLNPDFETEAFATSWDHKRAWILRDDASRHGGEWGVRARELADRIDPKLNPQIPNSLAALRCFREHRIVLGGALMKLNHEQCRGRVVRSDVIKPSWRRDVWHMQTDTPGRLFNELRATLDRTRKGRKLSGFILGGYHNEWDYDAQEYQPHVHIVAAGGHIGLLHELKGRRGYESGRGGKGPVADPVLVRDTFVTTPESALLYLFKAYWRESFRLPNGRRAQRRLGEPMHSESLIWLDLRSINDLIFLYGINVSKGGILLPAK